MTLAYFVNETFVVAVPNASSIGTEDAGMESIVSSGLLSVVIAGYALLQAQRAHKTSHTALLADMRAQWETLASRWDRVRLVYHGADTYYTSASTQEREEIGEILRGWSSHTLPGGIEQEISEMRSESGHVRVLARFLAYVSDQILRGNVSIDEVYGILGPDFARHRRAVRWIAGRQLFTLGGTLDSFGNLSARTTEGPDAYAGRHWIEVHDSVTENSFYDEQAAICVLAELMWATLAKRGDHSAHLLIARAEALRAGELSVIMADVRRVTYSRLRHWRLFSLRRRLSYGHKLIFKVLDFEYECPGSLNGDLFRGRRKHMRGQ